MYVMDKFSCTIIFLIEKQKDNQSDVVMLLKYIIIVHFSF